MAIISVSRRTDIPAFYTDWFLSRLGQDVVVPNPYNRGQAIRIPLTKDTVDCFVFWTKDPRPLLDRIGELGGYNYYFQYTLNGYGNDVERNVPPVDVSIRTFRELSGTIGRKKVIWRYDPILINDRASVDWHISNFGNIADALHEHTDRCVISFVDMYQRFGDSPPFRAPTEQEIGRIAEGLSSISKEYGLSLSTCCESVDLGRYGIRHGSCIDRLLILELFGIDIGGRKDGQRKDCGCSRCHDIGVYGTCTHGCVYCYAASSLTASSGRPLMNVIGSPVMTGMLDSGIDVHPIGPERRCRIRQLSEYDRDVRP